MFYLNLSISIQLVYIENSFVKPEYQEDWKS